MILKKIVLLILVETQRHRSEAIKEEEGAYLPTYVPLKISKSKMAGASRPSRRSVRPSVLHHNRFTYALAVAGNGDLMIKEYFNEGHISEPHYLVDQIDHA